MPVASYVELNALVNNIRNITRNTARITGAMPSIIMRANLSDAEAVKYADLYPEWTVGETYKLDWIVSYEGELYRIGQPSITASETYLPGATGTESIYSHIKVDEEGYEYWKAWDGITGLYNVGDIVRDPEDEQLYICISPNCTYGPPHSVPSFWKLYEK